MLIVHIQCSWVFKYGLILLCVLTELRVNGADNRITNIDGEVLVYDEIPVCMIVDGVGNFYFDAIFTDEKILYINISDLFRILGIPCIVGTNGNTLSGFISEEDRTYLIDYNADQIKVNGKIVSTKNRLAKEKGLLYMESSLIAESFGIMLNFNYRTLTISLKSSFELPIIKKERINKMRNNILKVKGEEEVDTILQRNYHLMKFGSMDWSVTTSQTWKGPTDNQFSVGIGTELLFGEADILLNYYDRQKFDKRQLFYQWRWVDNDKSYIKQAQLGTLSTQSISFLKSPIIGVSIRNSPTTIRKASGFHTISEFTEPNWTVELYINNILIDFTKADASGLYVFKVPVVYGYNTLKLKFYGPMGEESSEEQSFNMPYTFMPSKVFEYNLTAGMLQDSTRSRFAKSEFNYGVNRIVTIGGGVEYLSSITNGAFIPFVKTTIQPFNKLTLNAEYAHGVKARGFIDYYFIKDVLLEVDYTKYVEGQQATLIKANEERKIKFSLPVALGNMNGFLNLDYAQQVYTAFNYNQASIMFSAYYKQFNANSFTQLNWMNQRSPYVISDFALSFKTGKGITLRPSVQYNANRKIFTTFKIALEKYIPGGFYSISYERNDTYSTNYINLSFRYDLSFARTSVSLSHFRGRTINTENPTEENSVISQSAQGSLALGSGNNYIYKSNNSSIGKGGISLYPFLDLNYNGIFDKNEPVIKLSSVRIMGGKIMLSKKDSIIRIPDLYAYTKYIVEFQDKDLENIAWKFKKKRYMILIDPNQFKRIVVPIIPVGEVSGIVFLKTINSLKGNAKVNPKNDNDSKGIGRILVEFYDKKSYKKVAETLSEKDGYYNYLGLEPGEYVARIDSVQLIKLNYSVKPIQKNFTIKSLREGDIVSDVDFILEPLNESLMQNKLIKTENVLLTKMDEKYLLKKDPKIQGYIDSLLKVQLLYLNPPVKDKSGIQKEVITEVQQLDNQIELLPYKNNLVINIRDTIMFLHGFPLYEVQLFSYRKPVTGKDLFIILMSAIPGIIIKERLTKEGLYQYSTGTFLSLNDARNYLKFIRICGWKNGFVSKFQGGKYKIITFTNKDSIK